MAKDKPQPQTGPEIEEYSTTATPKAYAGSVPVFCAHDAIVPLKDLRPNPKNPNQHPPEQIKLLASIIRATGWRAPITVSKRSGLVTKGHGRLMAAQLDDLTDAPVDYQDYADALRLLCQPERSAGAGCTYSLMYYEKQGRYHAKDPKPGDQIFFSTAHSKSNVSHTGLVEKVDGSKVYTIEGNTSDQVARRSYYLSDNYIVGYGRPAYDAEPGNANTGSQTPSGGTTSEVTYTVVAGDTLSKIAAKYGTTYQKLAAYNGITNPNIIRVGQKIKIPGTAAPKKTIAEIAKEVIAGKWGNGADRKKRLEAAGYDYNAVQQAVNAALAR